MRRRRRRAPRISVCHGHNNVSTPATTTTAAATTAASTADAPAHARARADTTQRATRKMRTTTDGDLQYGEVVRLAAVHGRIRDDPIVAHPPARSCRDLSPRCRRDRNLGCYPYRDARIRIPGASRAHLPRFVSASAPFGHPATWKTSALGTFFRAERIANASASSMCTRGHACVHVLAWSYCCVTLMPTRVLVDG